MMGSIIIFFLQTDRQGYIFYAKSKYKKIKCKIMIYQNYVTYKQCELAKKCRIISVLVCGAPASSPSLTLVSAEIFLSLVSHSSLTVLHIVFNPSLNMLSPRQNNHHSLAQLQQERIPFQAKWNWLSLTRGSFWSLLTQATPTVHPPSYHYQNLTT